MIDLQLTSFNLCGIFGYILPVMSQSDYPSEEDHIKRAGDAAKVRAADAAEHQARTASANLKATKDAAEQQTRAAFEAAKAAKDAAEASKDTAQKTLWIAAVMLLGLIIDLVLRLIGK